MLHIKSYEMIAVSRLVPHLQNLTRWRTKNINVDWLMTFATFVEENDQETVQSWLSRRQHTEKKKTRTIYKQLENFTDFFSAFELLSQYWKPCDNDTHCSAHANLVQCSEAPTAYCAVIVNRVSLAALFIFRVRCLKQQFQLAVIFVALLLKSIEPTKANNKC